MDDGEIYKMTFTDEDLNRLKELLEKETKGEWSWEGYEGGNAPPPTLYIGRSEMTHGYNILGRLDPDANGKIHLDLVCETINCLPALFARLEAAEHLIEVYLGKNGALGDMSEDELIIKWYRAKGEGSGEA